MLLVYFDSRYFQAYEIGFLGFLCIFEKHFTRNALVMPKHIIQLISGPRNLSTALMYAFAQRPDTKVVDEPFYAHYLLKTGIDHPGREKIIASMESDPMKVQQSFFDYNEKDILFLKGMAHHLIEMDLSFLHRTKNLFLIRNPKQLIASFSQVIENPTIRDIGLAHEWELFQQLKNAGENPVVLDSGELLKNPSAVLEKTCHALGISYNQCMLSWPEGGRPEEGIWNTYWYQNAQQSTSFVQQQTKDRHFPARCLPLYEEAMPYYEKLSQYAIRI